MALKALRILIELCMALKALRILITFFVAEGKAGQSDECLRNSNSNLPGGLEQLPMQQVTYEVNMWPMPATQSRYVPLWSCFIEYDPTVLVL